jgi:hypothetical protein
MDELPELLVEAVGGERVVATVDLGGGDAVAVTPSATHLYRSEGLLSDESVETFGHDVERFAVEPGRRKSTLLLETIDGEDRFAVPSSTVDAVVRATLEGVLRTAGVVADDEAIEAQFRFSELTLVVTDRQLLKHVGGAVWHDEFEAFRFEDLTDLGFEEGSVATRVVVETDGRQQRVKVPNEKAARVRQAVQSAVFEHHGVSSLGRLRAAVGERDDTTEPSLDAAEDATTETGAVAAETEAGADGDAADPDDGFVSADWSPPADQDITRDAPADDEESAGVVAGSSAEGDLEGADVEVLAERVASLAERVDRQTELLETQQETIEQLVDELRRGR